MPLVEFQFTDTATVRGEVWVPQEMVDRIPDGYIWSKEIEEHIAALADYSNLSLEGSIEFDDVRVTPKPTT